MARGGEWLVVEVGRVYVGSWRLVLDVWCVLNVVVVSSATVVVAVVAARGKDGA